MLKNYVTIALRLLIKNKAFSLINIVGLSTGIACCVLITMYIQDEMDYEMGFDDHEKIFRVTTEFTKDGKTEIGPTASPAIAPGIAQSLPEIETFTRVMPPLNTEVNIVLYGDKSFFEKKAVLVDSTFFDVFPYTLAEGDRNTALDAPSSVVISEALAKKIFGEKSPLEETLIINSGTNADTFRITGVIAKSQFPSHLDNDFAPRLP